MSFPGFLTPSALLSGAGGLLMINAASPPRSIGGITLDITVEEEGTDELEITEHPVEQGAAITDHAYKMPASLRIRAMASNSSLSAGADPQYVTDIYNQLLALQVSGRVFTVVTGKRTYNNMLLRSIRQNTTQETAYALDVSLEFREIIIAATAAATLPPASQQALPQQTVPPQNLGAKQLSTGVPITPPAS